MQAYQQILPRIRQFGASLVAIAPELPARTVNTAEKNDLGFDVLSDVGNQVARRFGLVFSLAEALRPLYKTLGVDLPAYNGDETYELPIPGTFVVAADGTVRLAFVDPDYTHRLEPTDILECLRSLGGSAGQP